MKKNFLKPPFLPLINYRKWYLSWYNSREICYFRKRGIRGYPNLPLPHQRLCESQRCNCWKPGRRFQRHLWYVENIYSDIQRRKILLYTNATLELRKKCKQICSKHFAQKRSKLFTRTKIKSNLESHLEFSNLEMHGIRLQVAKYLVHFKPSLTR